MMGTCIASRLAVRASVLRLMVSITRPREEREASGLARVKLAGITALLEMPTLIGKGCERRPGSGLLSLSVRRGPSHSLAVCGATAAQTPALLFAAEGEQMRVLVLSGL